MTVPLWMTRIYDFESEKSIDEAISVLYDNMIEILNDGKFAECNSMLESININRLHLELNIGLIAITYPLRTKLSEWANLIEVTKKRLIVEGKNVNEWLLGFK